MSCISIVCLERGRGGGEDPLLRLELKLSWEVVGSFGDRDSVCVQGMGWDGKGRVLIIIIIITIVNLYGQFLLLFFVTWWCG